MKKQDLTSAKPDRKARDWAPLIRIAGFIIRCLFRYIREKKAAKNSR